VKRWRGLLAGLVGLFASGDPYLSAQHDEIYGGGGGCCSGLQCSGELRRCHCGGRICREHHAVLVSIAPEDCDEDRCEWRERKAMG